MNEDNNIFKGLLDAFNLTEKHENDPYSLVDDFKEAINNFDEKKAREIIDILKKSGYDVSQFESAIEKVFAKVSL